MALTKAIIQARHRTSSRINRWRQARAEKRFDEIAAVKDIGTTYEEIDRRGDVAMETSIKRLYDLLDDDEERGAAADVYATWLKTERNEEVHVRGSVGDATTLLRLNNDFWINGALTPEDDGGAA